MQVEIDLKEDISRQHPVYISGHKVLFPYKPYDCQADYLKKVIEALKTKSNALLESPTGTGKTLSLLCSALAWLKDQRSLISKGSSDPNGMDLPKIIYTSRTHSQLAQVQRELKATAYEPRTVLIASRDHLCANKAVNHQRGAALNAACRSLMTGRGGCVYGRNSRDGGGKNVPWTPLDIEDLHKEAQRKQICPYFNQKDRIGGADLIFMPYNYLIDGGIRENFNINFANSIIIFDEAHNIAQCCEEAASFTIDAKLLEEVIRELGEILAEVQRDGGANLKTKGFEIEKVRDMTAAFKTYLEEIDFDEWPDDRVSLANNKFKETQNSLILPGSKIFELMFKGTQFKFYDQQDDEERILSLRNYASDFQPVFDSISEDIMALSSGVGGKSRVAEWNDILKFIMALHSRNPFSQSKATKPRLLGGEKSSQSSVQSDALKEAANDFYVYIHDEEQRSYQQRLKRNSTSRGGLITNRRLGFWCFNAAFEMRTIQGLGPRSVILTSGTLSPLDSFQAEMGIKFEVQLENPHVINPKQVFITTLPAGKTGTHLNFSYQNRDNTDVFRELGETVARVAETTPGGVLIFFPSYRILETAHEQW